MRIDEKSVLINKIDFLFDKPFHVTTGLSHYTDELSAYKIRNKDIILPATITDKGYYHNYPTIAHELGHL